MIQFDFDLFPDPDRHRKISFVKSGLRILAGIALICGSLITTGILLIVAEILGIVEEIV